MGGGGCCGALFGAGGGFGGGCWRGTLGGVVLFGSLVALRCCCIAGQGK